MAFIPGDQILDLRETLMITAVIGSHSNFSDRGFRQKDVRFLFELFSNWMDSRVKPEALRVHNTQVQRYLDDLNDKAWAHKDAQKRYTLTRLGLIEFMHELSAPEASREFIQFQFIYFFLRTYGKRLEDLVKSRGSGFSKSLQLEMQLLLDHQNLLNERLRRIDHEIERLKGRIQETEDTVKMSLKLNREKVELGQIVTQVSKEFPYELQAQKPMTDLMHEIPPELRFWELTEGNAHRVRILWKALLADLESERKILKELKSAPATL